MNSIFRHRNADVERLFVSAGRSEKVMCVALDYAKRDHTAAVCDGSGRRLRGAFNVRNNREGLDFLIGVVEGLCRKHKIAREHVFFGGEDCGRYAFNFIHALASKGSTSFFATTMSAIAFAWTMFPIPNPASAPNTAKRTPSHFCPSPRSR